MLKNILYVSIFTACVVVASVILSIYHNVTTTAATSDTAIKVTPIPSGFDFQTVATLKTRNVVPVDLTAHMPSTNASGSSVLNAPLTPNGPVPSGSPASIQTTITPSPTVASSSSVPIFLQSVPTSSPQTGPGLNL